VVRLSAIGDVVMASPLAGALRRSFPEARIAWLVEEMSAPFVEGNESLDETIVVPRGRWKRMAREGRRLAALREAWGVARLLRSRRFDLVLDAQGLARSAAWAFLSGAPRRIGIGSKEGGGILMTAVVPREGCGDRISSQYRRLAEALSLDMAGFSMTVPFSQGDRERASALLGELGAGGGRRYAVLCPFTTRPQKHWLEERWAPLGKRLAAEHGLAPVILGGPADAEGAAAIAAASGGTVLSAAGRTTLKEAAALIGGASLLVGVDTGLTHAGFALRTPTVALFGSTRPYLDPSPSPGAVLYHPRDCSPCRRRPTCTRPFPCMGEITVDEVMAAVAPFLRPGGAA
jgi:heptosyltransferase-1